MQEETPNPTPPPIEGEQIGALHFVPNSNYPYLFKVDPPPRFWMEETTGALAGAVELYMNGEPLESAQLDLIKLYLQQFLERAVLASDAKRNLLLSKVQRLGSTTDIETFADELSEYGAEVF